MTHDDPNQNEANSTDFWGTTPDWSDATPRPRRQRSERHGDVTGAIKNLWGSAMSAGSGGTREHHVIDATAPRPADRTAAVDPAMFDDLDTEVPLWASGRVDTIRAESSSAANRTTEVPVDDAAAVHPDDVDDPDDDGFAAMTPVPLVEQNDNRRGMKGGLDPLLVRIGAAAVVTTLLVPIAIGMTSDDDNSAGTIASAADQRGLTAADASVAAAPADTVVDTTMVLDAESLPAAVPVNPTPSSSGASSESNSSSATSSSGESSASAEIVTASAVVMGEDCAIDYDVQFGDFWVRIAEGAGVSLAELLDANGATKSTPLYPDATICLPEGSTTPAPPETTTTTTAAPTTAAPTTAAPTTAAPTTAAPTTAAPTTAAPTTEAPAPSPSPAPDTSPAGPEEIKQIIRDVWPDELEERALELAHRESRYVPTAKNYCCYGLFQIYWSVHQSWLSDLGITDDQQLYDPATNARAAYALYQRSGSWAPWAL